MYHAGRKNDEIKISIITPDQAVFVLKGTSFLTPEQILNEIKQKYGGMFSELVFKNNILLRNISLGRQGVTHNSVLYLIKRPNDLQNISDQTIDNLSFNSIQSLWREQSRLSDLNQTRNEVKPRYFKQLARQMEENERRRPPQSHIPPPPKEMSSQPIPKFW